MAVNSFGAGKVFYLGARPATDAFHDALAKALIREAGISRCLEVGLPEGVTVQKRSDGKRTFFFLHNFKNAAQELDLGALRLTNALEGGVVSGRLTLPPYASFVFEAAS